MRIYYNSMPVPLAVARSRFFEANPTRDLWELGQLFGAATHSLGVGVNPIKAKQARAVLAAYGLEVVA